MTIGQKLVEYRKKEKNSQEKMAERLGISRQTLSNYENDITVPDLAQAKNICNILDISFDELVGDNNTLSSRVSNTLRMTKRTNKNIKILLITVYFIILICLISFIIYAYTNHDFTNKYQMEFTCYHKNDKNDINSFSVEEIDNDSDIIKGFSVLVCHINKKNNSCESSDRIYAGDSIGEVIDSVIKVKKVLSEEGYICH